MKVLIIGGGSIGHALAFNLSSKARVTLLVRDKSLWSETIYSNGLESGLIHVVDWFDSNNEKYDYVFIALPIIYRDKAVDYLDSLKFDTKPVLLAVPGFGGFEYNLEKNKKLQQYNYGSFQRVPYISRIESYGKEISITSKKDEVFIYLLDKSDKVKLDIEHLLSMRVTLIESHYQNLLSNSNPLLHTSRLFTLFSCKENKVKSYNEEILFYEQWNDKASKLYVEMDKELKLIYKALGISHLHKSVLEHYGVANYQDLTRKITSIEAFKKIKTPMVLQNGNFEPDLMSRYFVEDFSFGLNQINEVAKSKNLQLKKISEVLSWYNEIK